eukprot:4817678-Pyramimonas_sp.AAC.1
MTLVRFEVFGTHPSLNTVLVPHVTAWKKERTTDLVVQAVMEGFRGIDTACQPKHYYEPGVGEALVALSEKGIDRKEIFLQTKYTPYMGQDPDNCPYDPKTPLASQVAVSFATSQKNLQTDYVDSLVLHSPFDNYEDTLTVWRAMEEIHARGDARQLGIRSVR